MDTVQRCMGPANESTALPGINVVAEPPFIPMVSDLELFYTQVVVYVLLCGLVAIGGIVTNLINIVVFLRQGVLGDNGSVNLLGLAVADLLCVATSLWMAVCLSYVLAKPGGLDWVPYDVWYLTGIWPHLLCAQITRGVTAYVALERCLCVVVPFKAKAILTPRRSLVIIAAVFVGFLLSYLPIFTCQNLAFLLDSDTNTSKVMLVSCPEWCVAVDTVFHVNSVMFNVGAVVVVLVCTTITVSRVKLSKVWKKALQKKTEQSAGTGQNHSGNDDKGNTNQMSSSKMEKEKKLVRMITQISVILLISYIPDLSLVLMFTFESTIHVGDKENNLAQVMYCFTCLFETFNSSINIFVYYTMSSRYKHDLRALVGLDKA